eukprot:5536-Heterococcus_DN1.PRE.1
MVSPCAFKQGESVVLSRESVVLSRHSLHLHGDCVEMHHPRYYKMLSIKTACGEGSTVKAQLTSAWRLDGDIYVLKLLSIRTA